MQLVQCCSQFLMIQELFNVIVTPLFIIKLPFADVFGARNLAHCQLNLTNQDKHQVHSQLYIIKLQNTFTHTHQLICKMVRSIKSLVVVIRYQSSMKLPEAPWDKLCLFSKVAILWVTSNVLCLIPFKIVMLIRVKNTWMYIAIIYYTRNLD